MNELFKDETIKNLHQNESQEQEPDKSPKYKIVIEGSGGFSREFATIKGLSQYIRRNPSIKGTSYIFHEGAWERFVNYKSCIIPESILRNLLKSISLQPDNL